MLAIAAAATATEPTQPSGPAFMVRDLAPGTDGGIAELLDIKFRLMLNIDGRLFFTAFDPDTGWELWQSDGTPAGTALVRNILPGAAGAHPRELTDWNGTLAFVIEHPDYSTHVWRSDGTSAGTLPLRDALPGFDWRYPHLLASEGNGLFFATAEGAAWRTDGTVAGTVRLPTLDLDPRYYYGPAVHELLPVDDYALLSVFYGSECCESAELLRSEPSGALSLVYADWIHGFAPLQPAELTRFGGRVLFRGERGLWSTDGGVGTQRIWDAPYEVTSYSSPDDLTVAGDTLFFRSRNQLWKTDGTTAGTALVRSFAAGGNSLSELTSTTSGGLFFIADDGIHGRELWHTDPMTEPHPVRDIAPGGASSNPDNLTSIDGTLAFTTDLNGVFQLWLTTGTRTVRVQDLPGSSPQSLTPSGHHLFFSLVTPETGRELWAIPVDSLSLDSHRPCTGDCNRDGVVTIDELLSGVALALGSTSAPACRAAFCGVDCWHGTTTRPPTVDCLLRAVRAGLDGCPTADCLVDADCDDGNSCSFDACTASGCASICLCE